MLKNPPIWLLLTLALALLVRMAAVDWNVIPHGDLVADAQAAASILNRGDFLVDDVSLYTRANPGPYFYNVYALGGTYQDQHAPLWPVAAAAFTPLWTNEYSTFTAFLSFRLLSLFSGMLLLILLALVARAYVIPGGDKAILLWASASYLLIDYSGNGSFYILHAGLFLLWLLIAASVLRIFPRAILYGIVTAVAYLTNYQAIILVPLSMLMLFAGERPMKQKVQANILFLLVAFVCVLPWLIRMAFVFGDPLFAHMLNNSYVYDKAGIHPTVVDNIKIYSLTFAQKLHVLQMSLGVWLPQNLYYVARKLMVLLPILSFFIPFAFIDYLFDPSRRRRMGPILLLLVFHVLLCCAWPVVKFRYFVPLLPLVMLIGFDQLAPFSKKTRVILSTVIFLSMVVVSIVIYRTTPTHMYYYDGAITTDPFSSSEELRFAKDHYLLP